MKLKYGSNWIYYHVEFNKNIYVLLSVNIARVVSTNLYIIFLQLKKEANTVSNTSLLCRINWQYQIISLKTWICRSGSKGLRSDCICICGLLWLSCDLWWWFIVNCDDGLLWIVMMVYYACDIQLCLWHIIMPMMMLYCELWWFIVNWEGSVIRDIFIKKGYWSLCRV